MSIVPTGRRRDQVKQGGYKNASILNADLFEKIALTGEMDLKGQDPKTPPPSPNLQQATNGGTLNFDRGMGQSPFQTGGPPPPGGPGQPEVGQPEQSQGQPHSPFLTDTGEQVDGEEAEMNQGLLHERQRIREVLQGGGFIMEMDNSGKDGSIQLKLRPQPGLQIQEEHYEKLLQSLAQIGINPTAITDPDPNTGQFSIRYKTNVAPDKVMKPGRGR